MTRCKEILPKKLWVPILLAILLPSAASLGSHITKGDWSLWLKAAYIGLMEAPILVWWVLGIACFVWAIILLVRWRLYEMRRGDLVRAIVLYPTEVIFSRRYAGAYWNVEVPTWQAYGTPKLRVEDYEVSKTARCEKCKTELEEEKAFWGGYRWSCIRCGRTIKSKIEQCRVADRLRRIVRSEVEEKMRLHGK